MAESSIKPFHFGGRFANQVLEWLAPDTEENFRKLYQDPAHAEYFDRLGWSQPGRITYKINSDGFRSDEFDGGDYVLALGCSYTMGYGLPVEETWPFKLGQRLGLRVANLAWGGYSADTCFRLAQYWIPQLQPRLVVMLSPPSNRFELLLDPSTLKPNQQPVEVFMPNTESWMFRPWDQFLKHYFLNEQNFLLNQTKNSLALRCFCNDLNIPCKVLKSSDYMSRSREEVGYARDYLHGGPPAHDNIVADILQDRSIS